jgi:putative sterol carrier protein
MTSAAEFMEALESRRNEPALRHLSGTIRFDLRHDGSIEPWLITIADGDVFVSRRKTKADCIAKMDKDLFEALMLGEVNAVAAALRGEMEIQGEVALLLAFQRLFPGPPATSRPEPEMIEGSR